MADSPPALDALSLEELKKLLIEALSEISRLRSENAALREENARLKGLPDKPRLKPSGMDKKTDSTAPRSAMIALPGLRPARQKAG